MSGVTRFWLYVGATSGISFVTLVAAANWYANTYETGEGDDSLAPLVGLICGAAALLLCLGAVAVNEVRLRLRARRHRSASGHHFRLH
jgi:hypothetical protein